MSQANRPMLEIQELNVYYGAVHALKGVNLNVEPRKIVTLIGCNGAGKTTLLKTISGLLRPTKGGIRFRENEITQLKPEAIVGRGLCHAPEGRGIFANLTVHENLELGAYLRNDKEAIAKDFEQVFLYFPRLKERIWQMAGTLSGGEQQMLAIGRALMARPELLLLDEPSLGLAPQFIDRIFEIIRRINESGTTILLVEQNARLALETASFAYVMETGRIVMSGKAEELRNSEAIRKSYLGES